MPAIYETPRLDSADHDVLASIHDQRAHLRGYLRTPQRWTGTLRRTLQARAIQGSNTIEGYTVSAQDAIAAVDDEPPLTADERTWAEIRGYRRALTYVLRLAPDPTFRIDPQTIRSLHFMLLEHESGKDPGLLRPGDVYVDDDAGRHVYVAPDADEVPALLAELSESLHGAREGDALVRAAMAHLNLVMIHPFRDGNGRMARVLQTAVLATDRVLEPEFSSIEEWLGANTADYYRILASTGGGTWNPGNDAGPWLKFTLRAHHQQAQTVRRRFDEAAEQWLAIDDLMAEHRLPSRMEDAVFDALQGVRVLRPSYVERAGVEPRTATRDLARLSDLGILESHGQTKGRYYLAGPELRVVRERLRAARAPLVDPYPGFVDDLRGRP